LWVFTARSFAQIPADQLLQSLRPAADVNDYSGILQPAEREQLEQRCRELRQKNGAQLAVVIVNSLQGGQIDDFAVKLFKQWGIGQQGKNNGVLLLVSLGDHRARIEVGYGLEPILPDALAGRVLDQQLFPAFKRQQYFGGLRDTVNRIAEIIERNEPPSPEELRAPLSERIFFTLFLSLFIAIGGFVLGANLRSRTWGLILFGVLFCGVPLLMGCVAAWPLAPLVHVPLALLMTWLGWHVQRRLPDWTAYSGTGPATWGNWNSSGGGFSSSWGGFGGGDGGGGSDWGGFGGGESGGGGASAGW
jgi:uncharacterized protein